MHDSSCLMKYSSFEIHLLMPTGSGGVAACRRTDARRPSGIIIFNAEFIIFNAEFIISNAKRMRWPRSPRCSASRPARKSRKHNRKSIKESLENQWRTIILIRPYRRRDLPLRILSRVAAALSNGIGKQLDPLCFLSSCLSRITFTEK